jgi:hypothetical protein
MQISNKKKKLSRLPIPFYHAYGCFDDANNKEEKEII